MDIIETSTIHQERLQAIAEKRKRQTEIENKRRQLEDDRRQLQHLKSKALRERWLLEGTPSSNAEEAEAMKKQMEEDDLKAKELEVSIQRLEKELELLENGISASSTQENVAEEARVVAREEKLPQTPKTPVGSAKADSKIANSPMKVAEGGGGMMKAVVHAVRAEDGALENGLHQLSSSEVDELIHKADEVTLSEASERVKDGEEAKKSNPPSQKVTPRKEITGVQAKPMESPKLLASGPEPSHEQPVTMIFMGYQNVEDENETKKVLGLEGTIKAELVVIEDAENKPGAGSTGKDHAPPNGSAATDPVTAMPQKQESRPGEQPSANDTEPKGGEQDPDTKKQRCKCCSVM
ncbi:paralemmin-1 isoform X9 [Pogona vitticeps]